MKKKDEDNKNDKNDFIYKFFNEKSELNKENKNLTLINEIVNKIRNAILEGDIDILNNVINGEKKDLIAYKNNVIYQITSSENQNIMFIIIFPLLTLGNVNTN